MLRPLWRAPLRGSVLLLVGSVVLSNFSTALLSGNSPPDTVPRIVADPGVEQQTRNEHQPPVPQQESDLVPVWNTLSRWQNLEETALQHTTKEQIDSLHQELDKNGFVILRNVYRPEQIAAFERAYDANWEEAKSAWDDSSRPQSKEPPSSSQGGTVVADIRRGPSISMARRLGTRNSYRPGCLGRGGGVVMMSRRVGRKGYVNEQMLEDGTTNESPRSHGSSQKFIRTTT